MAKKKATGKKVHPTEQETRHARIELPDDDYQRLKRAADWVHISISAYIRQAVMERIDGDERRKGVNS